MSFCAYKLKNKSTSIKRAYRLSVRLCRTPLPQEVDSSPLCSFSFSAVPTEKEKTGVFLQKFAKKMGCRPNWIRKILPLTASVRFFVRGLNVYAF